MAARRRPELYVTGVRHSGTTLTIRLARECGWDLGEPLFSVSTHQGLEWTPVHDVVMRFAAAISADGLGAEPRPGWALLHPDRIAASLERFRPEIEALDFPPAVKMPEYGQHLLLDAIAPDRIVLTVRERDSWVASIRRNHFATRMSVADLWNGYLAKIGQIVATAGHLGIPVTIVDFDRIRTDRDFAVGALAPAFGVSPDVLGHAWDATIETRPSERIIGTPDPHRHRVHSGVTWALTMQHLLTTRPVDAPPIPTPDVVTPSSELSTFELPPNGSASVLRRGLGWVRRHLLRSHTS